MWFSDALAHRRIIPLPRGHRGPKKHVAELNGRNLFRIDPADSIDRTDAPEHRFQYGVGDPYRAATMMTPTYTDATLVPGVTVMKLAHIVELRDAIVAIMPAR